MSFIGTQVKCKACEKTVYPVEQLSADGVTYHKSCFKCNHCKGTLKLMERMEKVVTEFFMLPVEEKRKYPMAPGTVQGYGQAFVFSEDQKLDWCNMFALGVEPRAIRALELWPKTPPNFRKGHLARLQACFLVHRRSVQPAAKLHIPWVTVENRAHRKFYFRCSHGGCSITPSNYAALEGILYCKHHFSQLFKEKGSYNHLITSASVKVVAAAASAPEE